MNVEKRQSFHQVSISICSVRIFLFINISMSYVYHDPKENGQYRLFLIKILIWYKCKDVWESNNLPFSILKNVDQLLFDLAVEKNNHSYLAINKTNIIIFPEKWSFFKKIVKSILFSSMILPRKEKQSGDDGFIIPNTTMTS